MNEERNISEARDGATQEMPRTAAGAHDAQAEAAVSARPDSAEAAALTVGGAAPSYRERLEEGIRARKRRRMTVAAAVLGACSLALVCVACVGLTGGFDGVFAPSSADSTQASDAGKTASTGNAKQNGAGSAVEEGGESSEGVPDAVAPLAQDGASSQGASPESKSAASNNGTAGNATAQGGAANNGATGNSSSGGTSQPSVPNNSGQSGNASPAPAPVPATVTVSISVESSAVGNPVSGGTTLTFEKGATVYDALCATGLSVRAVASPMGAYIAAIGGLAEKEHGPMSGWMYYVNGNYISTSCDACVLSDGDSISWFYVTG